MADINRNLLKALDGPAPQWLKGNDFVPMGDGNPLPVSNYVQGANGVWVPVSENNPVPAKLLGSNVVDSQAIPIKQFYEESERIVLQRSIRTSSSSGYFITPPDGAKGCVISLTVFGVTGTFQSGEGVGMFFTWRQGKNSTQNVYDFTAISTPYSSDVKPSTIVIYPGANFQNFSPYHPDHFISIDAPIFGTLRLQLRIKGEFKNGEGIDCQLAVQWLY